MDIENLFNKLEETLYDNKTEEKLKMLKALNEHHDRALAFERGKLITAILRTLGEVSFINNLLSKHLRIYHQFTIKMSNKNFRST
jgi:hypothetical protein